MPDPGGIVPAIVLAAGQSTRMGRNKLLIELDGRPLLLRAIDALQAAGLREIVVVTGHESDEVVAACGELGPTLKLVHNPEYTSGRATSVQAGLQALPPSSAGVLVMPGDVPFVKPGLIRTLLAEFAATGLITFPVVGGRKGHPVIFPAAEFGLLQGLLGDQTLHDYLLSSPARVRAVESDDQGCLRDFDTPGDLQRHATEGAGTGPD